MKKLIILITAMFVFSFVASSVFSQDMAVADDDTKFKRTKPTNRELRKKYKLPASPELMQKLQNADKLFLVDWNLEEAEKAYKEIIDISKAGINPIDKDFAEVYNNYGVMFFKLRNFEKAREYFDQAISISKKRKDARDIPVQPVFYTNLAFINYYEAIDNKLRFDSGMPDENKLEECFKLAGEALALDPNWARAYQCRGLVFWTRQNFTKAIEELEKGVMNATTNRQQADIRVNLGFVYVKKEQKDKALEQAEKALETDPENPYGYALKGFIHQHFRLLAGMDLNVALEAYTTGLEKLAALESVGIEDPHLKMMFHYNTACIYSIQNKIDKTLVSLEEAIKNGYRKYDYIMKKDRDFYNDTFLPEFKSFIKRMQSQYPAY